MTFPGKTNIPDAFSAAPGRNPGKGECALCGHGPAKKFILGSLRSFLVYYSIGTQKQWLCRDCALASLRYHVTRTATGVWWGVGSIAAFLYPFLWWRSYSRMKSMPAPVRIPGVVGQNAYPLDPGQPLRDRWQVWFGGAMSAVLILFIVLILTA